MRVVAIVPIKSDSKRVHKKNFKKVQGKPLYHYILDKLKKCNFDDVYVDTDSTAIKKFCKKKRIKIIHRIPKLATDKANGNDLLNYHAKIINADLYFQLFITAPLLKIETINNCIRILKISNKYDSVLTSKKLYTWFWFKNKPVNYNPKVLPRSQDALPVVVETTGLYGIKRNSLIKRKCRIGKRPYFYEVLQRESVDLDTDEDFQTLNFYLKNQNI